jgi:hypothetical protein
MATQGLFGNKYQQAVDNEAIQRRQLSQTGGLTGWAAITQGMANIGSELGYQGGQMFGGQTPAQVQQANYQAVIDSVPDFDPMNPESLQAMSSAMWQGGFYDEGMNMLNQSRAMQLDNAKIELYKAQAQDELTVDGPSPTEQIAMTKDERRAAAAELVQGMPRTTVDEMKAVSKVLEDGGYTDTAEYKNLRTNMQSMINTELTVQKELTTNEEQAAKVEEQQTTLAMKPVVEVGKGSALVRGYFLDNAPAGLGTEDTDALAKSIGGVIETYDNALSTARGDVTPGQASTYYEKILGMPEVYTPNAENFTSINPKDWFKGYEFSRENFITALDKTFGRSGEFVAPDEIENYIKRGLIIPGVTRIEGANGEVGTITQDLLNQLIQAVQ